MSDRFSTIEADGIRVTLDLAVGHLRSLEIERDGRILRPLHTAPWVDDPATTADDAIPPSLRYLSGDFLCAPFATSDVEPAPIHGWPANSHWTVADIIRDRGTTRARFRLDRPVMGAMIEKVLTLRDGHPFLYQSHAFVGGEGAIPVANHAMVRFPQGGLLSFSPKAFAETPEAAPEQDPAIGRSVLAYPARADDTVHVPMVDGSMADITRYPIAERHEDIVLLVERPGRNLGWLAAQRPETGEMTLSLKNPADYPITILWFSNGGRDYAPWNGRHVGVLGIEEGRTHAGYGHKRSIEPNPFSMAGIPTALKLDPEGRVEVRTIVGGLAWSSASGAVADIRPGDGELMVILQDATALRAPYDAGFLK